MLLSLLIMLACSAIQDKVELIVEAESFEFKGGWVVDPQFVEQMGSPYLLAHGMGVPVENAKTTISFFSK